MCEEFMVHSHTQGMTEQSTKYDIPTELSRVLLGEDTVIADDTVTCDAWDEFWSELDRFWYLYFSKLLTPLIVSWWWIDKTQSVDNAHETAYSKLANFVNTEEADSANADSTN
jgi:hypothetical protein